MGTDDRPPSPPPRYDPHLWEIRAVRDLFWLAIVGFAIWFGYYLRAIFTPVLIALVLAYLFHPLITALDQRWRIPRAVTVSSLLATLLIVVVLLLAFAGPALFNSMSKVAGDITQFLEKPERRPEWFNEWAKDQGIASAADRGDSGQMKIEVNSQVLTTVDGEKVIGTVKRIQEGAEKPLFIELSDPDKVVRRSREEVEPHRSLLTALGSQMRKRIQPNLENPMNAVRKLFAGTSQVLGFLTNLVGTTTYVVLTVLLIPVYFFFFAWQFHHFPSIETYLPRSKRDEILRILGEMDETVSSFFRGRLIIALIMGVMFSVGWWAAGVPQAFLLGMGTGLLSIVPFAAVIGLPFAMLLTYVDVVGAGGASFWFVVFRVLVWPTLVYGLVQFVEGWFLTPWIQSHSTNLSAVTILIVVFMGGAVGGLYGMILAIPLASCIKILGREALLPRIQAWAAEQ